MNIEDIKKSVRANDYLYSAHAEVERRADNLTFVEIETALLAGVILEQYEDTGRGASCLIVGFANEIPIHIVCGWKAGKVVVITVYIPRRPKFVDPWTRAGQNDQSQ